MIGRLRKKHAKEVLFLTLGVGCATVGLKGFLLPNEFLDGGAMGVSLLLGILTKIDLSILIVLVNFPFILLGMKQISKMFAIKSAIAILSLSILVHYLEFPILTSDKLLISVFGGFFLGVGIGLTIRGGAVIDGTEVLAIDISRKTSLTVGDFIAIFNVCLFCLAAFFVGIENAMYSMLTYLSASKTVDFIINGVEEYIGVTIISNRHAEIKQAIVHKLGRGVTAFLADEGYGSSGRQHHDDNKVLFCAVTRLEVSSLLDEVSRIDPKAFVIQHSIKDTRGGMIKKRPLH